MKNLIAAVLLLLDGCKVKQVLLVICMLQPLSAGAALINNNTFFTDTESSLDWLKLSETNHMSLLDTMDGYMGYRWATNAEVEGVFNQFFPGYYDTSSNGVSGMPVNPQNLYETLADAPYAEQLSDIDNFFLYFGVATDFQNIESMQSSGYYRDEVGNISVMGVRRSYDGTEHLVWGLDNVYGGSWNTAFNGNGILMVRTSVVPLPAAVWLFGSALGGLGWMRRRTS